MTDSAWVVATSTRQPGGPSLPIQDQRIVSTHATVGEALAESGRLGPGYCVTRTRDGVPRWLDSHEEQELNRAIMDRARGVAS